MLPHRGHSSGSSAASGCDSTDMTDMDMENEKPKKRIRMNLSHMSQEEKIRRRKMKNREAAQLARDRKKARMNKLESTMNTFAEERLKLAAENAAFRKELQRLREENEQLRQRLAVSAPNPCPDVLSDRNLVNSPIESAELLNASQPQMQGLKTRCSDRLTERQQQESQTHLSHQQPHHWTMRFACLLALIMNLTKSSSGFKSAPSNCWTNRSVLRTISQDYQKELQELGIEAENLYSLSRNLRTFGT